MPRSSRRSMPPPFPGWSAMSRWMPTSPQGTGSPIGGVAATRLPDGVISPGAIGYDINCGVRLMASELSFEEARSQLPLLADALYASCPSGVGVKGSVPLNEKELERVCREGSRWAERQGLAEDG